MAFNFRKVISLPAALAVVSMAMVPALTWADASAPGVGVRHSKAKPHRKHVVRAKPRKPAPAPQQETVVAQPEPTPAPVEAPQAPVVAEAPPAPPAVEAAPPAAPAPAAAKLSVGKGGGNGVLYALLGAAAVAGVIVAATGGSTSP